MTSYVNFDMLREVTDGEAELEKQLFALYDATTKRCLAQLKALTQSDDAGKWAGVVHELKGASGNIRAEAMEALCKQVEHLPLDPQERARACELLTECYAETSDFISRSPR